MMAAALRRGLAVLVVSAVWLMQASPAAALLGWSASGSHTSVKAGGTTLVTLTVRNDNLLSLLGVDDIGCIHVDVGSSFEIQSASTAKSQWVTSHSGGRAVIHSTSGGARLDVGESVSFSITALAEAVGSFGWTVRVIRDQDCGGSYISGSETITVSVAPAPTPSPTPTPTPRPTPSPTPRPTPSPTPRPTPTPTPTPKPSPTPVLPLPSLPLPSLPLPSLPVPSLGSTPRPASPSASPLPTPPGVDSEPSASAAPAASTAGESTASPRPTTSPVVGDGGAPTNGPDASTPPGGDGDAAGAGDDGDGTDAGSGTGPTEGPVDLMIFPRDQESGELGVEIGGIDLLGGPVWAVPAATIAGPGLLVLLWLALQAIGAAAWMPSVRRLRGEERPEAGSA